MSFPTAPANENPEPYADYVALNCEPFESTCDGCAEGEKRIVHVDEDTSAYICEDCIALEEKAIQAAADALKAGPMESPWVFDDPEDIARVAVNAYVMAKWRAEHSDGDANG